MAGNYMSPYPPLEGHHPHNGHASYQDALANLDPNSRYMTGPPPASAAQPPPMSMNMSNASMVSSSAPLGPPTAAYPTATPGYPPTTAPPVPYQHAPPPQMPAMAPPTQGITPPVPASAAPAPAASGPNSTSTPSTSTSASASTPSHLALTLPGEAEHAVPVYDSCDEIRAKIRALLDSKQTIVGETDKRGKPKTYTRARFLQDLGNVNTNSLRRFMDRDGEMAGAEIGVYYAAYCFFEKLRIFNGEEKGSSRIQAEKDYPEGRKLKDPNLNRGGLWITVRAGENPSDYLPEKDRDRYYFPDLPSKRSGAGARKVAARGGITKARAAATNAGRRAK